MISDSNFIYIERREQLESLSSLDTNKKLVAVNLDALIQLKDPSDKAFIIASTGCWRELYKQGYVLTENTTYLWHAVSQGVDDYISVPPVLKELIHSLQARGIHVVGVCKAPSGYMEDLVREGVKHCTIEKFLSDEQDMHFYDAETKMMLVSCPQHKPNQLKGKKVEYLPSMQRGIIYTGKWSAHWAIQQYATRFYRPTQGEAP